MTDSIQIKDIDAGNSQVIDEVKAALAQWLRSRGVEGAHWDFGESTVLFHHYKDGEYVAISNAGVSDGCLDAFNQAIWNAGTDSWRNQVVSDDCVWVHRQWIAPLLANGESVSGGESQTPTEA